MGFFNLMINLICLAVILFYCLYVKKRYFRNHIVVWNICKTKIPRYVKYSVARPTYINLFKNTRNFAKALIIKSVNT